MKRTIVYQIPDSYIGHKLFEFLHAKGFSRQLLTAMRHTDDCIFLSNGQPVRMNMLIPGAISIKVIIPETESETDLIPADYPIEILFEDEDIMVVNKPAGLPIHPSRLHPDHSLANAIAYEYQSRQEPLVFRCVNRLDKDTSGLTILAKHPLSAAILYQMVKSRNLERTYFAIVDEAVADSGTIDQPISRRHADDMPNSIRRYIDPVDGANAVTHFHVITRANHLALLELHLETGRTHQIRVHMESIGFPLIGDRIYHPDNHMMERQALHAGRLDFVHPITGQPLHFDAPLPADMQSFFPDISIMR